jgi:hypothetical protein
MNNTDCQKIRCEDYLADGGEPVWCYRAGCPAAVAVGKCPKLQGEENKKEKSDERN